MFIDNFSKTMRFGNGIGKQAGKVCCAIEHLPIHSGYYMLPITVALILTLVYVILFTLRRLKCTSRWHEISYFHFRTMHPIRSCLLLWILRIFACSIVSTNLTAATLSCTSEYIQFKIPSPDSSPDSCLTLDNIQDCSHHPQSPLYHLATYRH